jgi:hypothetical protein
MDAEFPMFTDPPCSPSPTDSFAVCALASLAVIRPDHAGRLLRVQVIAPNVHDLSSARGVVQVWSGDGWTEVVRREAVIRSSPRVEPAPVTSPMDPREVEIRMRILADDLRAAAAHILDHRDPSPNPPSPQA